MLPGHLTRHGCEVGAVWVLPLKKGGDMDKFIVRQNIAHYTQQLMTETDPVKRDLFQKLLAAEMVKQAAQSPVKI
jgi:hypothetical protein